MRLGEAILQVKVDPAGAKSGAAAASAAFDQMRVRGEQAVAKIESGFDKIKNSVFSLKGAFAALGVGLLVKSFIDAGRETENYMVRLRVLLGSVSEGKELFRQMNTYAARTPFEFREVMGAATALAGVMKGGVKEVSAWMPLIGDLAAAAGLGIEQTTSQVIKMLSGGSAAADMFRERGILAMLGFQQGVTYTAKETAEKLQAAWTSTTSKFKGATEALSNTWDGAMSNLKDSWFQFQQRVMVDGGVLTYLRSIVQVVSAEFKGAFGEGSGAAEMMSRTIINGMRGAVGAIGEVLKVMDYFDAVWETLKTAVSGLEAAFSLAKVGFYGLKEIGQQLIVTWTEFQYLAARLTPANFADDAVAIEAYNIALANLATTQGDLEEAQNGLGLQAEETKKQVDAMLEAWSKAGKDRDFSGFLDKVEKQFIANQKAAEEAAKKNNDFITGLGKGGETAGEVSKEMQKFNEILDQTRAEYDALWKAETERDRSLAILKAGYQAGKLTADAYATAVRGVAAAYVEALKKADPLEDQLEEIKVKFIQGYAALKDRNTAMALANKLQSEGALTGADYTQVLAGINQQYIDQTQTVKVAAQETSAWGKTLENAATGIQGAFTDFFVNLFENGVDSFEDLGKSLLDIFKRMLAEMATLAIARPIIVPIVQAMGGMLGGAGGNYGQMVGSILSGGQGGMGGLTGLLGGAGGGGASGINWGSLLTGGGNYVGGSGIGSYGVVNTPTGTVSGMSQIGGYSTGGLLAGAASGLYGYQNYGNGGLSSAAAGATYAIGGYAAGAAGSAALGALATGGSLVTAGSAALAAIPVVGWIALAAMAINSLSGGKLFGTRYKPREITSSIGIDGEGGVASVVLQEERQRGLFGGRQRRYTNLDASPEQQAAADELFGAVEDAMRTSARALGVEIPDIVSGAFKTVTDSKGKVKKEFSEVLGKVYEESIEDFQNRIMGENIIAVVGQSAADASTIAERWRSNAAKLLEGARLMLAAQIDIQNNEGLLGITSTLAEVVDAVEELKLGGEGLDAAYTRLATGLKLFTELTDLLGVTLDKSGREMLEFSAEVVEAAGGQERASQLFSSFFDNYFSPQERADRSRDVFTQRARKEIADLGAGGEGLTYQNFRERFEAAMPTLSADQIAEWLEAGNALADLNNVIAGLAGSAPNAAAALAAIDAIQESIFATLGGSIENIRLSQMGDEEKYNYFRQQADSAAASLVGMTDPDEIRATVARIDELQRRAWDSLDEGQRATLADEFVEFLEGVQESAKERLDVARQQVKDQAIELANAIAEALAAPSAQQAAAAENNMAAAETIREAADILVNTPLQVQLLGYENREVGGFER